MAVNLTTVRKRKRPSSISIFVVVSLALNLPLDSPMNQDSPIQKDSRPIGRKATRAKRGSTSKNDCAKFLEQIAINDTLRIEKDMKRDEAFAREKEYAHKQDMDSKDRETMVMDTSHMSRETKSFWKQERRDVMRKMIFLDDGPSNTNWLNNENH
ncbi:hypothetical protein L3X38_032984 [Prunus dulcis]|uniref:No apical meristem-associated C-terminal domain-containing protein n=1 Tax=Prunus dulcis TaxID=3755 RepID=A0AAD4VH86_PRUDU|nr:hypothetical protein L3X38_032984 [Prunus dulcis]